MRIERALFVLVVSFLLALLRYLPGVQTHCGNGRVGTGPQLCPNAFHGC